MRKANLLIDSESYNWEWDFDSENDRTDSVLKFQDAYEKATQYGDIIFNSANFDAIAEFIETVSIYSNAKTAYPWLSQTDQEFIVHQLLFRIPTPDAATNLNELDAEFPTQNNGILHIGDTEGVARYVFDKDTWHQLHIEYLKLHPEFINWHINNAFYSNQLVFDVVRHPQFIDWRINEILPNALYSNQLVFDVVKSQISTLTEAEIRRYFSVQSITWIRANEENLKEQNVAEREMLRFFSTELNRTFRNNAGDLIALAKNIADRNSYTENQTLSRTEEARRRGSRRLIFQIQKNGQLQYLSLDFENGQFEVCNERGIHIGVYNFSGIKTANADSTGEHDIWCLR
jgi:hypothetical protein